MDFGETSPTIHHGDSLEELEEQGRGREAAVNKHIPPLCPSDDCPEPPENWGGGRKKLDYIVTNTFPFLEEAS